MYTYILTVSKVSANFPIVVYSTQFLDNSSSVVTLMRPLGDFTSGAGREYKPLAVVGHTALAL